MAEKTLKKVEDQLTCPICFDTYTDPKLLWCFHVYCLKCLANLVTKDQLGQASITCPSCRQITPVPDGGVTDLQSAFRINNLLEIMEEHKKTIEQPQAELEGTSIIPSGKIKVCCREHVDKEVELYCQTCEEPTCTRCAIKGGRHNDHGYVELSEAFESYRTEIMASLEPMEKQLATICKALDQIAARKKETENQQATIKKDIETTFKRLHNILDARKAELFSQLHQLAQRKIKDLDIQKDRREMSQAQFTSCLNFMRKSLETESKAEVLMMKENISQQVKELTAAFSPDELKPTTKADIVFLASTDKITSACMSCYGQISATSSPDPSQFRTTGKGTEVAEMDVESLAVVEAFDFECQPCEQPIESLECVLTSEIAGTMSNGTLERMEGNKYSVRYKPTVKGRHKLHIKINGQHIRGSPFNLAVKSPIEKIGAPILTLKDTRRPWDVTVNQKGEIIVAEFGADHVSVFSTDGKKLRSFGSHGSKPGQFKYPSAVAVSEQGDIFVADWDNHRIQKFTSEGKFIMAVGEEGSEPLQFCHPKGITFNSTNKKLYVTDDNHHIQILNSDLTFFKIFDIGKQGNGKGQRNYPYGITCDSSGEVFMTDYKNHCIHVFTADGEFLRVFGKRGRDKGELANPIGIAVDSEGLVYISEENNHRVSIFTPEGEFVRLFGSRGAQSQHFRFPCGLCVDDSGVVYVCDSDNHRVLLM